MDSVIKLKIRKDYVRKSDGFGAVYLYVRLDKEKDKIELSLHWPPNLIDETSNQLLPQAKNDKLCADYNLIIRKAIANCNDILVEHRLANRSITMKEFLAEYHDYEKRKDFIIYMEKKIVERHKRGKIASSTKRSHQNALIWLKKFRPTFQYIDLTRKNIEAFETFLRKQSNRRSSTDDKLDANSIANVLKYIRAYINLAIKDNVPIENPFSKADVKTNQDQKIIEFLMPEQVAELIHIYKDTTLPIGEKLTLCRYLIACLLSLRISDIMKLTPQKVAEYETTRKLVFYPTKQQKTLQQKKIYLPIDDLSLGFVKDAITLKAAADAQALKISEPYGRKCLRKLGTRAGFNLKGFHTGRHTFATNFLRAGGKVYNLQHILGHSNINTTMGYVHVVETDTEEEMLQLSNYYQTFLK
jgi:integrase/recombinase XerD